MSADLDLDDAVAQYPAAKEELFQLKNALSVLLEIAERSVDGEYRGPALRWAIRIARQYEP